MDDAAVVQSLVDLGLGKGEARVYVALTTGGPDAATPLSRKAGVPQPKVYEYLRGLISMGYVSEMETSGRTRMYEAISPRLVFADLRQNLSDKIDMAEHYLLENMGHGQSSKGELVDFLSGPETVRLRIEDLVSKAQRNVMVISSRHYVGFFHDLAAMYPAIDFLMVRLSDPSFFQTMGLDLSDLLQIQPSVLFTDVDLENRRCSQSALFTPVSDAEEAFMIVFRNSFAPHYQTKLVLAVVDKLPFIELVKL